MALAILDARPSRVTVGEIFDTEKRYLYKSSSTAVNSSLIKFPTSATAIGSGQDFTYSFDGATYTVNASVPIYSTYIIMGMT